MGPLRHVAGSADAPGHPHIRPTFGLDMRGAGHPERLRHPTGLKFRDRSVTGRPARKFEDGLGCPDDLIKHRKRVMRNKNIEKEKGIGICTVEFQFCFSLADTGG